MDVSEGGYFEVPKPVVHRAGDLSTEGALMACIHRRPTALEGPMVDEMATVELEWAEELEVRANRVLAGG